MRVGVVMVACQCGCGQRFPWKRIGAGRPRMYVDAFHYRAKLRREAKMTRDYYRSIGLTDKKRERRRKP